MNRWKRCLCLYMLYCHKRASYQYFFATWRVLNSSWIWCATSFSQASTITPVVSLSSRWHRCKGSALWPWSTFARMGNTSLMQSLTPGPPKKRKNRSLKISSENFSWERFPNYQLSKFSKVLYLQRGREQHQYAQKPCLLGKDRVPSLDY